MQGEDTVEKLYSVRLFRSSGGFSAEAHDARKHLLTVSVLPRGTDSVSTYYGTHRLDSVNDASLYICECAGNIVFATHSLDLAETFRSKASMEVSILRVPRPVKCEAVVSTSSTTDK